jgi:hypothetical protein
MTYVTEQGEVVAERDSNDPAPLYFVQDGQIAVTTGGVGGAEMLADLDTVPAAAMRALRSLLLEIGDRVEAGEGEDHDTGKVIAVDGDQVTVAWEGGACRTTQPREMLTVVG